MLRKPAIRSPVRGGRLVRGCGIPVVRLALALTMCGLAMPVPAQMSSILVSNSSKETRDVVKAATVTQIGQRFTTGDNLGNYLITSVEVLYGVAGAQGSPPLSGAIHATDPASGEPTTEVLSLTAPATFSTTGGTLTFTAAANAVLPRGTYAMVVKGLEGTKHPLSYSANGFGIDSGGASGWNINQLWTLDNSVWVEEVFPEPLKMTIRGSERAVSVLVSNTGQTQETTPLSVGSASAATSFLQLFTTGSDANGYRLDSVGVNVTHNTLTSSQTATFAIYTVTSGALDSLVHTLITPSDFSGATGVIDFRAPLNAVLAPETKYLLSVVATGDAADDLRIGLTMSNNEDSGGAAGWSIGNAHRVDDGGSSGSLSFMINVQGDPLPPPAVTIEANPTFSDGQSALFIYAGTFGSTVGNTQVSYTLTRSAGYLGNELVVTVELTDNLDDHDYLSTSNSTRTLTFDANEATTTFGFSTENLRQFVLGTVVRDGVVTATVAAGTGYDVGTQSSAETTVYTGPRLSFNMSSYEVDEGGSLTTVTIISRISADIPLADLPITETFVSVSTSQINPVSATSPEDYDALSNVFLVPARGRMEGSTYVGESPAYVGVLPTNETLIEERPIFVGIPDDFLYEGDEEFKLTLEITPGSDRTVQFVSPDGIKSFAGAPITIIDNEPPGVNIEGLRVTSTPGGDQGYVTGEAITVEVEFEDAMLVDTSGGFPAVRLQVGDDLREARYTGLDSTGTTLTFSYTVTGSDYDGDGVTTPVPPESFLTLNGGEITGQASGMPALTIFRRAAASADPVNKDPKIVGADIVITSTPVADTDTYGEGETIVFSVPYDAAVVVDTSGGVPRLRVKVGSPTRSADYVRGSGTSTLVFEYVVRGTDTDTNGVAFTATAFQLNGGTISHPTTGRAADSVPDSSDLSRFNSHQVDGSLTPTIATLTGLALSGATLSPSFASATTGYTSTVGGTVTVTTVTATAVSGATATILPADADSGTTGHQVALARGENEITVTAAASDSAPRTYRIILFREQPVVNIEASTARVLFASDTDAAALDLTRVVVFSLTRTVDLSSAVTVRVVFSQGAGDHDYLADDFREVVMGAGDTSAELRFRSVDDFQPFEEGEEVRGGTLTATVARDASYDLGASSSAETEVVVALTAGLDMASYESDEDAGVLRVKLVARYLSRIQGPRLFTPVTYNVATREGTAREEIDYMPFSRRVDVTPSTFRAGGVTRDFGEINLRLTLVGNGVRDGDRTLELELTFPDFPGESDEYAHFVLPDGSRCGRPCRFPVTITDNESRGIEIEEVAITSDPGTDGTYVTGDEITVAVSYSDQLNVAGDPLLALAVGEEGRLRAGDFREAEYVGIGNAGRTLTFSYTVSETDHDEDGLGLGGPPAGVWGGITPNGAIIRSVGASGPVALGHPGLPSDPGHRINRNPEIQYRSVTSISSPVADANTYGAGESIVFGVPFDFPVVVDTSGGLPTFRIKFDGAEAQFMNYVRGSGTTALVFEYVVQAGDTAQDIRFSGNALERNGGRIRHTTTGQDAIVSFLNTSYTGVYPQAVDGSLSLPSASLTGLALSDVSLSPAFAAETVRYIGVVGKNVGETTITAMAVAGAAVVIMPPDSDRVAAGHQMALGSGTQEITVAVSRPGSAPRTYTVVVTSSPFVNIVSNTPSVVFQNFTDEFSHTLTRVGSLAEALTVQIELSQGPDDHDYYENDRRRVVIPAGQATVDWVRDVFPLERFAIGEVIRSGTLTATVVEGVGYEPGADRVAQTDILIGLVTWYEMESYEVGEDDGMLFYKMIARTDDDPARLDMETTQRGNVTQSNSARWGVDYTVGGGTGIITMRASDFRWDGASYVAEYPRSVTILSNTRVDGDRNFHLVMEGVSGLQEAYGQYARANGERCVTLPQDFSSAESCAALVTIIDNDSPGASIESLVSNVEVMSDEVFFAGGQASPRVAQWFTTGSEPFGYILSSVGVRFAGVSASAGETIAFHVYETTPGGGLGPLVYTLESPTRLTADGLNNYAAPANAALSADTAYALAFTSTGNFSGDFLLAVTPSDTERAGPRGMSGWSLADAYHLDGSPSPRGRSLQVNVKGSVRGVLAQGAPTITGTAEVGLTLEADTSGISDGDGLANVSYAYQWIRVDGGVETPIAGATGNTYALVAADAGKSLKVRVTFTDDAGLAEALESTEIEVTMAEGPPVVPALPMSLVSNLSQDSSFDASVGDVRIPSRYTQKFTTGGHGNGYDLASVAVRIFEAQASGGESVTAYLYTATDSGAQGERLYTLVTPSPLEPFSRVNEFAAPSGAVLYPDTVYFLSFTGTGDSRDDVRIVLTSSDAEDAGGEADWAIEDEYRFNGQLVGALGGDYAIMMGVRGSVRSDPLPNYPATGRVEVTGGKGAGRTLTAMVHDAADLADGLGSPVYAYQWFQVSGGVDSPIAGATEMTYRLESADVGKQVRAVASFEDAGGNAETLSSVAYPPGGQVRANDNADLASLSIDGVEELYVTKDGSLYVPLSGITSATERVTLRFSLARADAVCEVRYSQNDLQNNAALSQAAVLLEEDACPGEQTLDVTLAPGHNYVAVFVAAAAGNLKRFIVALYREEEPDYTLLEEGATRQGVRYSFPEASPGATIRIVLSGDATVEEDYVLYSLDGSAATLLTGPDYTVSVLPGGYVDLAAQAVDDAVVEGDEVFMVTLRWDGPTQPLQGSGVGGRSTSTDYVIVDNDAPATGVVLIVGAAQLGRTLQADLGGIVDLDGLPDSASSYAYRWTRVDGSTEMTIAGATGNTYTVVPADVDKMLEVRVEFTDLRGNSETLFSELTMTVLGAPSACPDLAHWCAALEVGHAEPQAGLDLFGYSGRQRIGRDDLPSVRRGALSVSVIAYEGVTYQVLGINLHVRPGGTQFVAQFDTFLPAGTVIRVGDLGFLTDEALDRDGRGLYIWDTPGFSWMDSQQVTVSATFVSPATGTPVIRGRAEVGLTLMADTSGIADANGLGNVSYSYQWSRVDGGGETPIAGETGRTYEPVADDVGKALKVAVSFQDDLGHDEAAASAATGMVVAMADGLVSNLSFSRTTRLVAGHRTYSQRFTTGSHLGGYDLSAVRVGIPEVNATGQETLTLYIRTGGTRIYTLIAPATFIEGVNEFVAPDGTTLSAETDYEVEMQPTADGQSDFVLGQNDSNRVVGEAGWRISGNSPFRIAVLGQPRSNVPATGTVTVEGAPEMGQPLTVSLSGVADADGLTAPVYSYQWFQVSEGGASVIPGAVGAIFVPGAAELGRQLLVRVAFEDDMGFAEALESALTPPVALTPSPRLVSNTGQSTSNSSVRALHPPRETPQLTQSFTTGDHADGYVLSSVGIRLADVPQPSVADLLHFHIYTATPSGGLGERAHTLVSPAMLSADSVNHFAAPANAVLHAGVDYLLAFTFESNLSIADAPDLIRSNSDGEDIGGAPGWRIEDTYREQGRRVGAGRPWVIEVRGAARSPGFPGNSPATGAPTIPGIPSVSQSLVADTGGISDRDGLAGVSYAYQWIRVDGSVETAIPGETGSTYTVLSSDEGKGLRVRVTFTDDAGGAEARTSAATVAVVAAQEQVLVSNTGFGEGGGAGLTSFGGPPDDYSQLFTTGGNARGYGLSSVGVAFNSVSNNSSETVTLYIYTTTASKAIDQLVYTLETPAPLRQNRVNDFAAPPGAVLSANTEYALAASVNSTSDFFLSLVSENGEDSALPGWSIENSDRFRGFVQGAHSWQISVRGQVQSNVPATGAPWISGTVQEGQGLIVQTADIRDGNGVGRAVYSYQWLWVSGDAEIEIPGATGNTYIPTRSDVGKLLRVRVTFADDEGNEEELVSAVTRSVAVQQLVLVSNLAENFSNYFSIGFLGHALRFGQGFVTGDNAHGYELSSVGVSFGGIGAGPGETMTVHIYTTTSGVIDQLVYTLKTPATLIPFSVNDFAAPPNAVLSAMTPYAAVFAATGNNARDFQVAGTTDDTDSVALPGWSIEDQGLNNQLGHNSLQLSVRGRVRDQARFNRPAIGAPQIAGRVQVGHTLTAIKGSIEEPDGLSNVNYTYQWIRLVAGPDRFFEIPGATGRTYVPVLADEGKALAVRVSFTDDAGFAEEKMSVRTVPVVSVPTLVGNIGQVISFDARVGNVRAPTQYTQRFTTGSDADGYDLFSVGLRLFDFNGSAGETMVISLYEANNDGSLGTFQYSLRSPKRLVAAHHTVNEFLAPEGATLAPDTDYLLSFTGTGNSPHDVVIQLTSSEDQDTGGETDWEIEDEYRFNGQLVSDFPRADPHVIMMRVRGQPRSEPRPSIPHNSPASGAVTVKGGQRVGTRVTASVDAITDDNGMDGATYAYQWFLVDGEVEAEILGATEQVYLLGSAEEGRQVRVRLSFQDDDGYAENFASAVYPSGRPVRQSVDARLGSLSIDGVEELYVTKDGSLYVPLSGITSATESVMLRFTLSQADASCQVKYSPDDLQGSAALGQATELLGSAACTGTGQQVVDVPLGPGHNYVAVLVRSAAGNQKRFIVALYREAEADYTLLEEGETRQGVRYSFPEASTGAPIRIVLSGDATVEEDYVLYRLEGSVATRLTGPNYTVSVLAGGFVDLAAKAVDDAVEEGKEVFMVTLRWDGPAQPLQGSGVGGRSTSTDYAITDNDTYVATGAPVITGLPQVGQTLMVGTSGIVDLDGLAGVSYAYQWIRVDGGTETDILQNSSIESASGTGIRVDGSTETDIPGATGPTYVLVAADEGKTLKVRVSFTDDKGYVEVLTSAEASVVLADVGVLAITGGAQVGQTLTADTSGIVDREGVTGVTYRYQWIRVDGDAEADLLGATSATYTLVAADEGKTLKVEASFTDDASNAETRTSAETPVVLSASADMRLVSNTGQAVLPLSVVGANRDTSGDVAQLFTTGRHANGYDLAEIGIRLGEIGAHAGETLTFQLHEAAADGGVGSLRYILTTPATLVAGQVNDFAAPGTANLHAETSYVLAFTGTGDSLGDFELSLTTSDAEDSASATDWSVADSYLYQGNSVSSGDALMMELRGTARSTPIPDNIPPTGAPVITGAVRVGFALTAGPGSITDGNGTTDTVYAYQWIRVDGGTETEIPGATGSTYILVAADEGKTLKVRASFTDGAGYFEMSTSGATVAVLSTDAPEVLVGNIAGLDLPGTPIPAGGNLGLSTSNSVGGIQEYSQGFRTGRHANGYNISSVAVNFDRLNPDPGDTVTFHIYTPAPSGVVGDLVYTLTSPMVLTDGGVNEYAAPANAFLHADTDYRLVHTATNTIGSNLITIRSLDDNREFPAEKVAEGWRLEDSFRNANGRLNNFFNTTYQMRVYGAPRSSPTPNIPATGAPTISGMVEVGGTLTADTGSIRDLDGLANASYSYQWIRVDGGVETEIPGATGNTYVPVGADVGARLKVAVSFRDDRGYDEERESATTIEIAGVFPLVSNLGQPATSFSAVGGNREPLVTQQFTTGNNANGYDLSSVRVRLHNFSNRNITFYIYSAKNDGTLGDLLYTLTTPGSLIQGVNDFEAPANATLSEMTDYLLAVTARGSLLDYRIVTAISNAEDAGGAAGWSIEDAFRFMGSPTLVDNSLIMSVRGAPRTTPINFPATGAPTISGTTRFESTLTVGTGAIMDANGLSGASYSYQWIRVDGGGETEIPGATGTTYALASADVGTQLKVAVSFQDDQGKNEVLISAATSVVRPARVVLVGNTGRPVEAVDVAYLGQQPQPTMWQEFRTGPESLGYDLDSVGVRVSGQDFTAGQTVMFHLYTTTSLVLDELVYTLTTPATLTVGVNDFVAPVNAVLSANTTYALVTTSTGDRPEDFRVALTNADDEDPGAAAGWSLEDAFRLRNGTLSHSGDSYMMEVRGNARASPVPANSPATGTVVVAGVPRVGQALTVDTSGIADANGLLRVRYSYQWLRVEADSNETEISRATDATYVPTAADFGKTLKVRVVFTDDRHYREESTSVATAPVAEANFSTLVGNLGIPSNPNRQISAGDVADPARITQLFTTGDHVNGYDLRSVNVALSRINFGPGETVRCSIYTATSNRRLDELVYTLTTPATLTVGPNAFEAPANATLSTNTSYFLSVTSTGGFPLDLVLPEASDGVEDVVTSNWSIEDSWRRFGSSNSDLPMKISVDGRVRVRPLPANNPATGTLAIDGVVQVGRTLTADTDSIMDADGLGNVRHAYQWIRVDGSDEAEIQGATGNVYLVRPSDEGLALRVRVNFADDTGFGETLVSAETVSVAPLPPVTTLVSNTAQLAVLTPLPLGNIMVPSLVTQVFRTGTNTLGYDLSSVGVDLDEVNAGPGETLTFFIYTATATRGLGELVYTLTTPATLVVGVNDFAAPPNAVLSAEADYLLAFTATGDASSDFAFGRTLSSAEDPGAAPGWSIEDGYRYQQVVDDGHSLVMSVNGRTRFSSVPANTPAEGGVFIGGTKQPGRTLTAYTGTIVDADGLVNVRYAYQWLRVDGPAVNIQGATDSRYTLGAADLGKRVQVRVSFVDNRSYGETLTSPETADVEAFVPTLVSNFGEVFSPPRRPINAGTVSGPDGLTQQFTTGDDADGYHLDSIGVWLDVVPTSPGSTLGLHLYTVAPNGGPGSLVHTLMAPGSLIKGENFFEAPANATLSADTSYVLSVTGMARATFDIILRGISSDTEDFAEMGWSIGDVFRMAGNPDADDLAFLIEVRGSAISASSPATGEPVITGTAQVGQTLTAGTGNIMDVNGLAGASYAYQWIRVAGGSETDLQGETGSTYAVVAADEGTQLKVRVSFQDDRGNNEELASAPTAVVVAMGVPVVLVSNIGQPATSTSAVGGNREPLVTQQFTTGNHANGYDLSSVSVRLNPAGSNITFYIYSAKNDGTLGDLLYTLTTPGSLIQGVNDFESPANATLLANTDYLLTVTAGGGLFDYQIITAESDAEDADGAAGWSIAEEFKYEGRPNSAGRSLMMSVSGFLRTSPILPSNTLATGAPAIVGTAQVGRVLTADTSAIMDADGLGNVSYAYQWVRVDGSGETDITGATGMTYTSEAADEGKTLKVRVTFQDDAGNNEALTSAETSAVAALPVTVSPTELTVLEGDEGTYEVSLDTQPTAAVTVTVESSHADVTLGLGKALTLSLIFTDSNVPQSVTVNVTDNQDVEPDRTATLTHAVSGTGYGAGGVMAESVSVTVPGFEMEVDGTLKIWVPVNGIVEIPLDRLSDLRGLRVELPSRLAGEVIALKPVPGRDVESSGLPGFRASDLVVDIFFLEDGVRKDRVTLDEGETATVCLPTDAPGRRVYVYEDPEWVVLPQGGSRVGQACGVTEHFSQFALGSVPRDKVTKPWLARIGRTIATQVAEAVSDRLSTQSATEAQWALGDLLSLDERTILSQSSFVLPLSEESGPRWTAWGRGSYAEFDGREDGVDLEGEALTGMAGIDFKHGRWLAGLALSHSEGDGEARGAGEADGPLEISLTGAHPYLRMQVNEGLSLWGMLGYGEGELERDREEGILVVDLDMHMGVIGLRGRLATWQGMELAVRSEVLAVRLETDAEEGGMAEIEADVTQARLLLESRGRRELASGGVLQPRAEIGARYDTGDAEGGMGVEFGAGLRYADNWVTTEGSMRGLLAHEENDYDEWGVSGMLELASGRAGRGLALRLDSSFGMVGSETQELWSRRNVEGIAQDRGELGTRFEAELGYGLNAAGGRGVLTPYAGFLQQGGASAWRLGSRLEVGDSLNVDIEGILRRRESDLDERHVDLRLTGRW